MSESTAPARCTETEFEAARAAGLLVVSVDDERAIHAFAEAIRADLLSALEELVEIVEDAISQKSAKDLDSFTLQPARAAIAKATGSAA